MSCPNILKFSTFLAHQRPQDAQVRPLHHACVAREETQRTATQPVAHIGLLGWAHRGTARAAGLAGPKRGAPLTPAWPQPLLWNIEAPTPCGHQESLTQGAGQGTHSNEARDYRAGAAKARRRKEKTPPFRPALQTLSVYGPGCGQ